MYFYQLRGDLFLYGVFNLTLLHVIYYYKKLFLPLITIPSMPKSLLSKWYVHGFIPPGWLPLCRLPPQSFTSNLCTFPSQLFQVLLRLTTFLLSTGSNFNVFLRLFLPLNLFIVVKLSWRGHPHFFSVYHHWSF